MLLEKMSVKGLLTRSLGRCFLKGNQCCLPGTGTRKARHWEERSILVANQPLLEKKTSILFGQLPGSHSHA